MDLEVQRKLAQTVVEELKDHPNQEEIMKLVNWMYKKMKEWAKNDDLKTKADWW